MSPMGDAEIAKLGRKLKLAPFMFGTKEFRRDLIRLIAARDAQWLQLLQDRGLVVK